MNLVHRNSCILCVAFFLSIICLSLSADTFDLSGKWDFQIGLTNSEVTSNLWVQAFDGSIHLPGTTAEAHIGNPFLPESLSEPASTNLQLENFNPKRA